MASDPKPATTKTDKALAASDPSATVIGALLGIAGSLDLVSRIGLSADEAILIVGFVGSILAALRGWVEKKRRDAAAGIKTTPVESAMDLLEAMPLGEAEDLVNRRRKATIPPEADVDTEGA